jgi:glycerophosphoryl diester phosphodiesterase
MKRLASVALVSRAKILLTAGLSIFAALGVLYVSLARTQGEPARDHPYFALSGRRPLVIAHRGGGGLWPENTLYAFERAANLGVDVIEIDVRLTSDGELVVMHDATVERTTDGQGSVAELTLIELQRLDAGHRWSADGGQSFPLRGRGLRAPTLREVFERLPRTRFIIEPKDGSSASVKRLCALILERGMGERALVGSFRHGALDEFRRACPGVATSASAWEASQFLALYRAGLASSYSPAMQALQLPERAGAERVLTRGLIEAAHGRQLEVHAWTINDNADMRRLLDAGVDGIMTDYPDRLLELTARD